MADLQLNKPLYKSTGSGAAAERTILPRAPRASIMARTGAVLLDIIFLHFAYLLLIKLAPGATVRLGSAGEWFGLAGAWLYFSFCGSHLTWGRTLGKLVMRVQVSDVTGPELPLGRAALRAALLLCGCVFPIAMTQYATRLQAETDLNPLPTYLRQLGWALNWGWLFGNLVFSAYEPFGRSLIDRIVGSAVNATDAEPATLQEYFADVRGSAGLPAPHKSWFAFASALGVLLTIVTTLYIVGVDAVKKVGDDKRAEAKRYREALSQKDFSQPIAGGQLENSAESDRKTTEPQLMSALLTYEHIGPIDVEELKRDPRITGSLDRIVAFQQSEPSFRGWFADLFNRMNKQRFEKGEATTTVPKQMRLEVSFAEKADLFFASEAMPKYSISKVMDLDPGDVASSRPLSVREQVAADRKTTGTR
ncbi:MAG: RDD family protein [Candidatus Sumerlaeaceae bacterium]